MDYSKISDLKILQIIGNKLKKVRLEQNIKQKELAEKSGLSLFSISQMETGHNTSIQSLIQVLRAMGRMDLIETLIKNDKAEMDSPQYERQRVSRIPLGVQPRPKSYVFDEEEEIAMAAEDSTDY